MVGGLGAGAIGPGFARWRQRTLTKPDPRVTRNLNGRDSTEHPITQSFRDVALCDGKGTMSPLIMCSAKFEAHNIEEYPLKHLPVLRDNRRQ